MESDTAYMLSDTLRSLCNDPRLLDIRLSNTGGRGVVELTLKPGSLPGISSGGPDPSVTVVFDARRAELHYRDPAGRFLTLLLEGPHHPPVEAVINSPLEMLSLLLHSPLATEAPEQWSGIGNRPAIDLAALRLLLRHALVTDLQFGSNGRECTFQFQVADSFAGTAADPPRNWIGLDFNDRSADLGWFDRDGGFRMTSFQLPEDSAETGQLFADPLGHVLKHDDARGLSQTETGMRALLGRLQAGFAESAGKA